MTPTDRKDESQKKRFIKAAKETGADMSKEEFTRVIGKLGKSEKSQSKRKDNSAHRK